MAMSQAQHPTPRFSARQGLALVGLGAAACYAGFVLVSNIAAALIFQERLGLMGLVGAALLLLGMLVLYRQGS
jgi:multidrug transporter EmrE-like cation transporter